MYVILKGKKKISISVAAFVTKISTTMLLFLFYLKVILQGYANRIDGYRTGNPFCGD